MNPIKFRNIYPLVICYIAIENGPVEIVDFPIWNMVVDLSMAFYVSSPEGNPTSELTI